MKNFTLIFTLLVLTNSYSQDEKVKIYNPDVLHKFYNTEFQVDSAIKANYVAFLLNYSQKNKNIETIKQLEFPQRFGFPALVILDSDGKRLHTQNTVYLEKGRGYDIDKLLDFLKAWSPAVTSCT